MRRKLIYPAGLLLAVLLGVAIGAMVYELSLPMQMRIKKHYELEFRVAGLPVSSYNWGEFYDDETKILEGQLWNVGTVDHNTTWTANIPTGWNFTVDGWPSGTFKLISVDNYVNATLRLSEVDAYAGSYSFDLNFTVSD